jgi:pimeloyl-ACP methyl ester carboxylesterase
MSIAKLKDIEIYYELHGDGKPLVLIAGYASDHLYWEGMLGKLAQHFQVLTFDNRGAGQTKDADSPFTIETMANDTMALIKYLNLAQPHIVGHSMGGAVAQAFAHQYPDHLNKLIIANSAHKLKLKTFLAMESLLNLRKDSIAFDHLIDTALPWFFSSAYLADPKHIELFKKSILNNPYLQSIEDQERQLNAMKSFDSQSWLHEIKVPTLIIGSEEDILNLPLECQHLATALHAGLVTVPGGHSSPIEQAEKLSKLIMDFLN